MGGKSGRWQGRVVCSGRRGRDCGLRGGLSAGVDGPHVGQSADHARDVRRGVPAGRCPGVYHASLVYRPNESVYGTDGLPRVEPCKRVNRLWVPSLLSLELFEHFSSLPQRPQIGLARLAVLHVLALLAVLSLNPTTAYADGSPSGLADFFFDAHDALMDEINEYWDDLGSSISTGVGVGAGIASGTGTDGYTGDAAYVTAADMYVSRYESGSRKASYYTQSIQSNGLPSSGTSIDYFTYYAVTTYLVPDVISVNMAASTYNMMQSWRRNGYDVLFKYAMGSRCTLYVTLVQSGGWYLDNGSVIVNSGANYSSRYNANQSMYTDGSGYYVTLSNTSAFDSVGWNQGTGASISQVASTGSTGNWFGVLYANGTTGGTIGDDGSTGGTYNSNTTNITNNTTYNNLDLDLSPITQRQDAIKATLNQIGLDLQTYAALLDMDFQRLFAVMAGTMAYQGYANELLEDILAELQSGGGSGGGGSGGSVSVDLTDVEGYLEDILSAITNYQDEDSNVLLIRGYLAAIEGDFENLLDLLDDWPSGGSAADLTTIEHELVDLLEQDGVTLTTHGLLYWTNYYMQDADRVIHDIYDELAAFTNDFTSFWADLADNLDTIIYDLEHMQVSNRRVFDPINPPSYPPPDDETGIVPWEDVLNITALRDALTRLMNKFPFATINSFVTLLTALVRPAVAPQFDLPMPNPSDWSRPYSVHVDLSDWSQAAAVMRVGWVLWAIARVSRRTVSMWTREEAGGDA